MWVYAATKDQGGQSTAPSNLVDGVTFDDNLPVESGSQYWPLPNGIYRAFIVRHGPTRYETIAASERKLILSNVYLRTPSNPPIAIDKHYSFLLPTSRLFRIPSRGTCGCSSNHYRQGILPA